LLDKQLPKAQADKPLGAIRPSLVPLIASCYE